MKKMTASSHERDYWIAQLLGWGGLAVIGVLTSSIGEWHTVLRFALAKVLCMVLGLALSHIWRNQLRRRGWFDQHRTIPFKQVIGGLLILSVIETTGLVGIDVVIRDGELVRANPMFVFDLLLLVFLWFVVFLVWTLCYAVALSRRRALRFELEKLELEVSVKDAELRALQAQVNPHFFFNSLNSIRALVYEDADAAALAVSRLAAMMRHNLQAGQADTVRLADELAAVDAYLGMEKLRFDERLQLEQRIAPGLDEVRLPPMVLQTLVENAIKHGVEVSMDVCQVRISAQRDGSTVLLEVANQGRLASASSSTRLGLANASKRLALLFGPGATCQLSEKDGWVRARVALPQEGA
ncbi:MAG: histidine kinase [Pseudomonadota bacterium]